MTSKTAVVCKGCAARHHERCTGWTDTYEDRGDGVLRLVRCECPAGHDD